MPLYLVTGKRALKTIESASVTIEADDHVQARNVGKKMLSEGNGITWEHVVGPFQSHVNVEEVEILANGDEQVS